MKSNSKKIIKTRFCNSTIESLPHQGSIQSLLHHVYLEPTKPMFMKPHSSWMSRDILASGQQGSRVLFHFPFLELSESPLSVNTGLLCFFLGMILCYHMRNLLLCRETWRDFMSFILQTFFLAPSTCTQSIRGCFPGERLTQDPAIAVHIKVMLHTDYFLPIQRLTHRWRSERSQRSFLISPLPFIFEEGVVDTVGLANSIGKQHTFLVPASRHRGWNRVRDFSASLVAGVFM